MPRVIIGRKNRLGPARFWGLTLRVQFYVTNADDHDRALGGARVLITRIDDETVVLVNDTTDEWGKVVFDFKYMKDTPIYIKVTHPGAARPYQGRSTITPHGINLELFNQNARANP